MHNLSATVVLHEPLQAGYRHLVLRAPEIARVARPGQFVHVRVTGLDASALRRPFSIHDASGDQISILYKTVGRGTDQLARLNVGDTLSAMGPLGNGFPVDGITGTPVLVGGGFGVAPLAFLARRLPVKGLLLVGGRTADDVLCIEEFKALGWEIQIATMDGSLGVKGLVTAPLDAWLASTPARTATFFACGPDGMLRAVGERALRANMRAWLSLDKHMVCGVGACLACVQRLQRPDGTTHLGRVCRDGPIFEAREIVWEEKA
jgi:dihydroorotate dehydrogenase electron transfer subunit